VDIFTKPLSEQVFQTHRKSIIGWWSILQNEGVWGYNPFDAAYTYHYFSVCFHVDSKPVRIHSVTNSITKSSRLNIFKRCLPRLLIRTQYFKKDFI
jgi:hypothetical protein